MHCVRVICKEYHVIEWVKQNVLLYSNLVDSLDHIYDKMPKLIEQYVWYSLQKNTKFQFIQFISVYLLIIVFIMIVFRCVWQKN